MLVPSKIPTDGTDQFCGRPQTPTGRMKLGTAEAAAAFLSDQEVTGGIHLTPSELIKLRVNGMCPDLVYRSNVAAAVQNSKKIKTVTGLSRL